MRQPRSQALLEQASAGRGRAEAGARWCTRQAALVRCLSSCKVQRGTVVTYVYVLLEHWMESRQEGSQVHPQAARREAAALKGMGGAQAEVGAVGEAGTNGTCAGTYNRRMKQGGTKHTCLADEHSQQGMNWGGQVAAQSQLY